MYIEDYDGGKGLMVDFLRRIYSYKETRQGFVKVTN